MRQTQDPRGSATRWGPLFGAHARDWIECPVSFDDTSTAARAFIGAGPMQLAIHHSGQQAVADAVWDALVPFIGTNGQITLPAW